LLTLTGSRVETHAVAGTTARGVDAAGDLALAQALLASGKDRGEHAAVVQHLREQLTPECRALDIEPTPRVIALPRMQHLETRVTGYLREAGGGALLLAQRLHPTPAVGGWPVAAASTWLQQHEFLDRGFYAGVVGYLTRGGDAALAVAIRSAVLGARTAYIYAGAGIVADSDPAAEWQETDLKLTTMCDALTSRRDRQ
jgi:isochorismate synthase